MYKCRANLLWECILDKPVFSIKFAHSHHSTLTPCQSLNFKLASKLRLLNFTQWVSNLSFSSRSPLTRFVRWLSRPSSSVKLLVSIRKYLFNSSYRFPNQASSHITPHRTGFVNSAPICTTYCEKSTQKIVGPPQTVSDHITCDTDTCPAAVSNTYTATESFEINIGVDANAGDDTIKGGASGGASWSWSQSSATSNTYTFTLKNGDSGNIVFRPYYHQSCGDLKYFAYASTGGGDGTADTASCGDDPINEDTNACGQTPIKNGNFADGDFTFCYSDGPKAGQGC